MNEVREKGPTKKETFPNFTNRFAGPTNLPFRRVIFVSPDKYSSNVRIPFLAKRDMNILFFFFLFLRERSNSFYRLAKKKAFIYVYTI